VSVKQLFHKKSELRGKLLITISAVVMMAMMLSITIFLTVKGMQSFVINEVDPITFLTQSNWNPTDPINPTYGAWAFIFGSIAVTLLSALVATPISIGCALFMTEIAKKTGSKLLQPVMEILVGIPSVVYGLVGLTVIVPLIRQYFGGSGFGVLAGTIVISMMIFPTITSIAADALRAIPQQLNEASYALGATRWETISKIILPSALPALLTAVILGMARAFGEALAVQMVIGNAKDMPQSLLEPAATITSIITLSMGHTPYGSVHNNVLWSLGLILLIISFLFIMIVRFLSKRSKI